MYWFVIVDTEDSFTENLTEVVKNGARHFFWVRDTHSGEEIMCCSDRPLSPEEVQKAFEDTI